MSGVRTLLAAALLLATGATGTARAGTVVDLDLPAILAAADRIAEGTVVTVDTITDEDGTPWRRVVIDVRRELGDAPDDAEDSDAPWTLRFLGGADPSGPELVVDDLPRPEPGDRVLVAADQADGRVSPVVGVWQGWFDLTADGWRDAAGRILSVGAEGVVRGDATGDADAVLDALRRDEVAPVAVPDETGTNDADTNDADADDPERDGEPEPEPETNEGNDVDGEGAGRDEQGGDEQGDVQTDDERAEAADATPRDPVVVRLSVPVDAAAAFEAAAEAWREAGVAVRLDLDEEADDRVTIGDADAFGPYALSFTMRWSDRPGVEVRLRPGAAERRPDLALRELAWLAGVPDAASGLRSGRLPPEGDARPTEADVAAWSAARRRDATDLTGDGRTSFYDLVRLADAFGRTGTRLAEDLDRSGRVDDADLERLRERYVFEEPSRTPPDGYRPADGP